MLKILGFLLVAYLSIPLLNLFLGIRPFTFQTPDDPSRYGLPYETVEFETEDHLLIRGWFIPAASSAKQTSTEQERKTSPPTILVGHGYPFDKANILRHVLFLHQRFNLLLIDFRYFGESEGWMTTVGIREVLDVKAALDYLSQRPDVDASQIGAMGFSMSAAVFIIAQDPRIQAIVADSPYASLTKIVERQFFFLPGLLKWPVVSLTRVYTQLILGLDILKEAPLQKVKTLSTPVLLIHGEADSQIPVEHARQIAANANPDRLSLWIIPEADHGQAHAVAGPVYELRVLQFFTNHLETAAAS